MQSKLTLLDVINLFLNYFRQAWAEGDGANEPHSSPD